jgi:hypothetical protein
MTTESLWKEFLMKTLGEFIDEDELEEIKISQSSVTVRIRHKIVVTWYELAGLMVQGNSKTLNAEVICSQLATAIDALKAKEPRPKRATSGVNRKYADSPIPKKAKKSAKYSPLAKGRALAQLEASLDVRQREALILYETELKHKSISKQVYQGKIKGWKQREEFEQALIPLVNKVVRANCSEATLDTQLWTARGKMVENVTPPAEEVQKWWVTIKRRLYRLLDGVDKTDYAAQLVVLQKQQKK